MALQLLLGQLLVAGPGGALYLEVRELEKKCFIQEIPEGTVVLGTFPRRTPGPASAWGVGSAAFLEGARVQAGMEEGGDGGQAPHR